MNYRWWEHFVHLICQKGNFYRAQLIPGICYSYRDLVHHGKGKSIRVTGFQYLTFMFFQVVQDITILQLIAGNN